MRPTLRCLQVLSTASRASSISFIGLGRMGHEMALNIFTKKIAAEPSTRFVVCDAVPEASQAFSDKIRQKYSDSQLEVVSTPAE